MRTWAFLALETLALAGCGRPSGHAAPTTTYQHVTKIKEGESARIAATPGLVIVRGAFIDVLHNGQKIYTSSRLDCRTFEDCQSFYFIRPVRLKSPTTHQVETYAQLGAPSYPTRRYIIPLENGEVIRTAGEAAGSPDGRWLAFGMQAFDDPENQPTNLTFRDMSGKKADIVFNTPCAPDRWLDTERMTVLCQYNANDKPDLYRQRDDIWFEGIAQPDNSGQWTVRRTRTITRRVLGF